MASTSFDGPTPQLVESRLGTSRDKTSRKEFGPTWSTPIEAGSVMIGDEITINGRRTGGDFV